jgi:hypothetical protein
MESNLLMNVIGWHGGFRQDMNGSTEKTNMIIFFIEVFFLSIKRTDKEK